MSEQSSLFATEYKSIPAQIGVDEAQGIVECFVAGIGNKDSVGDICLPNCFSASLRRRKPRVVWGHNWNEPIGKVLEIYEVPPNDPRLPLKMKKAGIGGLFAKVQFNLRSERGREAFNNVAFFGEEQEWSIGYKTLDAVFDPVQQANLLKEVELYEVSPVLHGANQLTGTISIKSDDPEAKADGPCWPGYQQVGMKKGKNGKMVPNCVPIEPESKSAKIRDPKGGLTPAGRKYFKRKEGANLKPGVKGPADTPEKMRRKGSFLTRFYTNPSGPLVGKNGKPTRLALAAAAWGEPVPRTASDAAELAAKGRRLLERYQNVKKKGHPGSDLSRIYETDETMNPAFGFVGELAKAISARFGGKVKIRTADKNMVIFDLMNDYGDMETMRLGYHYEDGEFMFGNVEPVKPETIYMPIGKPSNMPGNAYVGDDGDDFGSAFGGVAMKPGKGDCGCGCGGAKSCSVEDMPSWDSFKSENPGIHLFIQSESSPDELWDVANTVASYHGFSVKSLEDGLVIPNSDTMSEEGYEALLTAVNFLEEKAIGRKLRRAGRMAMERFDPNAFDGDDDGLVQDNTPFERPNKPKSPRMMPPMNPPRKVPEPAREPIRPPVRPTTPAPTPTPTPSRPQRPVPVGGRGRVSGSVGRPPWGAIPGQQFAPDSYERWNYDPAVDPIALLEDMRDADTEAEAADMLDAAYANWESFSELTPAQRKKLRKQVSDWAQRNLEDEDNPDSLREAVEYVIDRLKDPGGRIAGSMASGKRKPSPSQIWKMRTEQGMSLDDVAKKFGMSREDVRQIEMRYAKSMRDKIWDMRTRQRMSLDEVAQKMNMTREQVRQLEMRQGKSIRDRIWKMRTEQRMSLDDVAKRMNMPREAVRQIEMRIAADKRRTEGDNPKGRAPKVSGSMGRSSNGGKNPKWMDDFSWPNVKPSQQRRGSSGYERDAELLRRAGWGRGEDWGIPTPSSGRTLDDYDRPVRRGIGFNIRGPLDAEDGVVGGGPPQIINEDGDIVTIRTGGGQIRRIDTSNHKYREMYDSQTRRGASGAMSANKKPKRSGFEVEAQRHLEKFGWTKGNKTPSFDTRGSRVIETAVYDKAAGVARFTLKNGKKEEYKVDAEEAENLHAGSVLERRPSIAVEEFLDKLRKNSKKRRAVSGSMGTGESPEPDVARLMQFDVRGSRNVSNATYDPQRNIVRFELGDGQVEQYQLDYETAKKFGARSGQGLDDMRRQLQSGRIGKRVLTRQQNQAIDWARKNQGFQIVRRILDRIEKNQISTADLNRLEQLWRDYGNRR